MEEKKEIENKELELVSGGMKSFSQGGKLTSDNDDEKNSENSIGSKNNYVNPWK